MAAEGAVVGVDGGNIVIFVVAVTAAVDIESVLCTVTAVVPPTSAMRPPPNTLPPISGALTWVMGVWVIPDFRVKLTVRGVPTAPLV